MNPAIPENSLELMLDAIDKRNAIMISDVLSDAVAQIDDYLRALPDVYQGTMRDRILRLRRRMDEIRAELDAPPALPNGKERS